MKKTIGSIALLAAGMHLLLGAVLPGETQALAIFARNLNANCSMCHIAWPMLNSAGRAYKENGYRFNRQKSDEAAPSDFTDWKRHIPLGLSLTSQPYDKVERKKEDVRLVAAVVPLVAGKIYDDLNGYARIQAAANDAFDPDIPLATLGYNGWESFNGRYAWGAVTFPDAYDTYAVRRMTRGPPSVAGQSFGGAENGGVLNDPRHSLFAGGRLGPDVFYNVGLSGGSGDTGLSGSWALSGRLAYDIAPEIMVGGLLVRGRCDAPGACRGGLDFGRYAFDMQMDFYFPDLPVIPGVLRLTGAYLAAVDGRNGGADIQSNAWYVQSLYVIYREDQPTFAPTLRFDGVERGTGHFYQATLNLSYFITWNIKTFLEYAQDLHVPDGQDRNGRITLQVSAAF